ncbi:aldo/keto reductase [Haloarchaeobius iranensis]|uniref:Predicted oxidoreductase n=1 Tax=Haloarchaeobius iranensis TaxID=996166 RepID=A0A1G9T9S2_9EURY|nr:aldo/keto reductase [Haloarchaeobius iranensis]SDM44394.1 Predicted oxidoreductase [Haloarchaeobius iranensis]
MVTSNASWAYRDEFHEAFARTFYRRFGDGLVSSIGVGTYLGEPTDEVDERYHDAITEALATGVNVVDTAINYRCQRSERVVGRALADSDVDRDAVLVSTKGGFVPFDGSRPADPGAYIQSEYVDTGIVDPDELVRGSHCMAPAFLDDQLDRSLANLDLDTIDLYYVHNPETQLAEHDRETVYDRLEAAFERLEERAAAGDIDHYGVASWECFRVPADHESYLSLAEVIARARSAAEAAGNAATHFRAVQLPFNVHMADGFTVESQPAADGPVSTLRLAHEADLDVFTSASILQGDLADGLPEDVDARVAGETSVQRAINFARSAPGVTSSLVGASRTEHVAENVDAGRFEPLGADAFDATFE